jgi:formylglycine-generating enzyme required for sulfatase activity
MEKETFLSNLKNFLNTIVCERLFAEVSDSAKQMLEKDIEEFIRENAAQYSLEELKDIFTSADISIGLFMEYRDAKILNSGDKVTIPHMSEILRRSGDAKQPGAIDRQKNWWEPVTGMLFVWVPGGSFQMGCGDWDNDGLADEQPVHEVHLDGFWIAKFAVTVAQYMRFPKETDSHFPQWMEAGSKYNIITGDDDEYKKLGKALIGQAYPIVGVSWHDAVAYAKWLTEISGRQFSLPTEAEWEYAARSGGKPEKYPGGCDIDQIAWYAENSGGKPHPVGTKAPNGLGIHNMSGNVSEWCLDLYSRFAYGKHDPRNPVNLDDGQCRVVRGGSYNFGARDVRCTDRSIFVEDVRDNDLGFRLVMKEA